MRVVDLETLIDAGGFSLTSEYGRVEEDIRAAIDHVRWPEGGSDFVIYPESGRARHEGNGVKPIKNGFVALLHERGWILEQPYAARSGDPVPGAFDAFLDLGDVPPFVAEWETGNVSSSHRAVNKMLLGLQQNRLSGGILVLPTRNLARYLTDRVGNFEELTPYFKMWSASPVERGFLGIISVEHDATSLDVPRIPKGSSGRALG